MDIFTAYAQGHIIVIPCRDEVKRMTICYVLNKLYPAYKLSIMHISCLDADVEGYYKLCMMGCNEYVKLHQDDNNNYYGWCTNCNNGYTIHEDGYHDDNIYCNLKNNCIVLGQIVHDDKPAISIKDINNVKFVAYKHHVIDAPSHQMSHNELRKYIHESLLNN